MTQWEKEPKSKDASRQKSAPSLISKDFPLTWRSPPLWLLSFS